MVTQASVNIEEPEYDRRALKALAFYHDEAVKATRDGEGVYMLSFWRGAIVGTMRMTMDARVERLADRVFVQIGDYIPIMRDNMKRKGQ